MRNNKILLQVRTSVLRKSWCLIRVEVKNDKLYLDILLIDFRNYNKKREKILCILFVCQFITKGQKSTQNTR